MESLRVQMAATFWQRLRGLIGRAPLLPGEGLYIPGCRQVHTFFMAYPIDVVFVDAERRVLAVVSGLKPWRFSQVVPNAAGCLEILAGTAAAVKLIPGSSVDKLLTLTEPS